MRVVRVLADGVPSYGILGDGEVDLLEGPPFGAGPVRTGRSVRRSECALLAPVTPTKILAIGSNYAAHAQEMGHALAGEPPVFLKPLQSIVPDGGTVVLPPEGMSSHVEHEAELAVVIGREARNVARADAARHVFGFTCADDVSARDLQRSDTHITRAKGFDTFCPLGPHVETDVSLTGGVDVTCSVNGEPRQSGNTRDLVFDVPTLIEWLSRWTTLVPGDVVLTGSPAGSGRLVPGDEVEVTVQGVGTLRHSVAATPPTR